MPAIKSVSAIAEKWSRVTPQRRQDYEDGVRSPKTDWASATAEAEERYSQGVQEAIGKGSFGKGVSKAGTAKWKQGAIEKGARRWPEGVQVGKDAYQRGFAPYADAIAATTLPGRYAKRDPRNIDRVRAMNEALIRVKESQS